MRKVELIRGRRVVVVDQRLAPLLEKHSGYRRRDMVAQQPVSNPEPAKKAASKAIAKKAGAKKAASKAIAKKAGAKKAASKKDATE